MPRIGAQPRLTAAQQAVVMELHAKGLGIRSIALRMRVSGRTIHRIVDPAYRERDKIQAAIRYNLARKNPTGHKRMVMPFVVSKELLDDRDRREELRRNISVTAALCGDPLPGYSALDRSRENAPHVS